MEKKYIVLVVDKLSIFDDSIVYNEFIGESKKFSKAESIANSYISETGREYATIITLIDNVFYNGMKSLISDIDELNSINKCLKNKKMKNLKANELADRFFQFGNKGSVWENATHIAKSGDVSTLCGTLMLSSNWAIILEHQEIGCQKCLSKYSDLNVTPRVKEPKYRFTRSALWFCTNDEVTMSDCNKYFTDECFNQLVQYGYLILI